LNHADDLKQEANFTPHGNGLRILIGQNKQDHEQETQETEQSQVLASSEISNPSFLQKSE
jgi:hypothetical protein